MMKPKLPRILWTIVLILSAIDLFLYLRNYVNLRLTICGQEKGCESRNLSTAVVADCYPGIPCDYPDEVDLRIIVMTYNRAESLKKMLSSLDQLELDGDTASLEIWLDRKFVKGSKDTVNNETLRAAKSFTWKHGQTRVHVHKQHVGLHGQWIDTWRPRADSKELALILEDDLSISPFAYRWLRAVHKKYGSRTDIAGYTLQSEGVIRASGGGLIKRPPKDTVLFYKLVGSWGYAPHPKSWMKFQDWYHEKHGDPNFHPYVPKASMVTGWFKSFEHKNTQENMWTIWHIYYCDKYNFYTVFNNILAKTRKKDILLAVNRQEPGLHYGGKGKNNSHMVLKQWSDEYLDFPENPMRYDWDGSIIT